MNSFKWQDLKTPFFVMAPMAGITDSPFRQTVKEYGADILFSEMISADAIYYSKKSRDKSIELARFSEHERPFIIQIFGSDPKIMASSAKLLAEELRPDGIDINMGCPAKKVVSSGKGSALLKDKDLSLRIISEVRGVLSIPLSVKMRLGWDKSDAINIVKELDKIGVDAVTVHARTTKDGFGGKARWEELGVARESFSGVFIANGDVKDFQDSEEVLKTSGADGVMIGRGALGNPWIFKSLKERKEYSPGYEEIVKIVMHQTDLAVDSFGEKRAILEMRKHYGWYFKGFAGAGDLRKKLISAESLSEVKKILS